MRALHERIWYPCTIYTWCPCTWGSLKSWLCHSTRYWGGWGSGPPSHTTSSAEWTNSSHPCPPIGTSTILHIYTDSKYAFHIFLSHATIWKECGLFMTKGGSVTNANQIMAMLKASHLPTAIGIVHCRSHQMDDSIVSKGNNRANEAARAVALRGLDLSHPPQDILTLQPTSSPLTPAKLCPIFTNSFILTAKHSLLLSIPISSLLLRTYAF